LARSLDSELDNVGLESSSEGSGLGLASWLTTPRRMMSSAANLFNLDSIVEHHETDSGHSSDVDDEEDDLFSTNVSGEQGKDVFVLHKYSSVLCSHSYKDLHTSIHVCMLELG